MASDTAENLARAFQFHKGTIETWSLRCVCDEYC